MKTNPWYSTEVVDEKSQSIHHNNTSCPEGGSIEKNHRRYGTDNRPLCKQCGRLNELGR
jgi:hypothetical protein